MRIRLGPATIVLAALAAGAALWLSRADEVGAALERVAPAAFAAAVALHVATLALRSEAWGLTLAAAHAEPLSRGVIHAANAAAFVAGSFQSQAALPARVAVLRRIAGERAPRVGVIVVADLPIFALELCATALLVCVAGIAAGGAWWIAPAAVALAVAALTTARLAPRRFARCSVLRGLAVLADRRRRGPLGTLVAGIVALTLARVWLVLAVCGLPHAYAEVVAVLVALGVLGLLPIGPGAAPAATVAAVGGASVGASVAAGLLLAGSSIVAVLAYGLVVALVSRVAPRRRRRVPATPLPASA